MISTSRTHVKFVEGVKKMLSYPLSRRMHKRFLLSLTLLVFCSCSLFKSQPQSYPNGVIFPLVQDGEVLYTGRITDVIRKRVNHLFFSTDRGFVYSINGERRKIRWLFRTRQESISPPYLGKKSVYVFDDQGTLYCIDLIGRLSWKTKINEKITSGITEDQGRIYMGTENGSLYCLDPEDGRKLWRFRAEEAIRSTPVLTGGKVIFGCDDHRLYILNRRGNIIGTYEAGGKIQSPLLIDGQSVFFGSHDDCFTCFDLERKRVKWKIDIGCLVSTTPVADKKRVIFLCWNGILYCLNKKNGNIFWWDTVPSRSFYGLEKVENRIMITSLSSLLVTHDIQTGQKVGEFESGQMIQSNPVWFEPYVVVNQFDNQTRKGHLVFLKKEVKLDLESSVASPQKTGEEILFTAKTTGFFKANYEFSRYRLLEVDFNPSLFFLSASWEKEAVQEKSEKETWQWLPEVPGLYVVAAEAIDEKEQARQMISYLIEKEKPRVTIKASKQPPLRLNESIIFNARAKGLKGPQYAFSLSRFIKVVFHPATFSLSLFWESEVVQPASELSSWTWTPEGLGLYMVQVTASGEKETVEDLTGVVVEKEKPKVAITSSAESPQGIRKKITFEAKATGIKEPHYRFFLTRLKAVDVHPSLFFIRFSWEKKEVQEESEKGSWEWRPRRPGIYIIKAEAIGEEMKSGSSAGFRITMQPDRRMMNLVIFLMDFIKIFIPVLSQNGVSPLF